MPVLLSELLLNDRGFAFDPVSGESYQLSTTALRIVRMLQQGLDEDALLKTMVAEFEVDEKTGRRDLQEFLDAVQELGWKP